jgi:hypothetical protein
MDLDEADALREHPIHPDDDSGSAYKTDSEIEDSSSHDEQAVTARSSRASSVKSRGRKTRTKGRLNSEDERLSEVGEEQSGAVSRTASLDDQFFEDAEEWASNFQAPDSPGHIKNPPRRAAGSRKLQTKRKAQKPANEIRAKRLKRYYNNDYRELLNIDIQDTVAGRIQEDNYPLQASQIGASTWTSAEKDLFFTALARLGRDNIRGIAARIGSKSELQVQEYIQILHQGIHEKRLHRVRLLAPIDMPAAIQISDECCGVLERAGDALDIRQERAEEKIEQAKWGESWLLTKEVRSRMEKRRKEEGGEEDLDEVLPAMNLFNLKQWLQLSEKLFMNPAAPYEEDNWQNLAEAGETPAIRATAFEDFHSLAVNITKRLVSTTLYCTMSRLRATRSNKTKHADVNLGDVEAAVNILGLTANSDKFWIGASRRCHLQVVNDGFEEEADDEGEVVLDKEEYQDMTYDEVEAALKSPKNPSRSRSTSRLDLSRPSSWSSAHSELEPSSPSSPDLDPSSDSSVADYPTSAAEDSESSFSSNSSTHFHFSARRLGAKSKRKATRKAVEKAQDDYTEAFDMQACQLEEARLWALLKQDPPFEVGKVEPLEKLEMGRGKSGRGDGNWREWVGFWSPWEMMEIPVAEEEFERNKALRKAKRRGTGVLPQVSEPSGETSGDELGGSQDEEEESDAENAELLAATIEVEDDLQQEDEDADAGISGHTSPRQYEDDEASTKME